MDKTIYDVTLAELIPMTMTSDPDILAKCAAFDAMSAKVTDSISSVRILSDIGNQPSAVTDFLAVEQQTPYYDQTLPLAVRQSLLANTGHLNMKKGTKESVSALAQIIFGPSSVTEWFTYSGEPYHFVVFVSDVDVPGSKLATFTAMLDAIKPARAVLDSIVVGIRGTIQYYGYRGKTINSLSAYTIAQLGAGINMD